MRCKYCDLFEEGRCTHLDMIVHWADPACEHFVGSVTYKDCVYSDTSKCDQKCEGCKDYVTYEDLNDDDFEEEDDFEDEDDFDDDDDDFEDDSNVDWTDA